MPGKIHESLIATVETKVIESLYEFKRSSTERTAKLAASIRSVRSGSVNLPRFSRKTPDGSFDHTDCPRYPSLVLEVAHSQRQLPLEKLAKDYIQKTKGAIRTVVGIKVDYESDANTARFMIWQASQPDENGEISVNKPDTEIVGTLCLFCVHLTEVKEDFPGPRQKFRCHS